MPKEKYIALVDCDSFFVSCEQKKNPDLKGKPVSVISNPNGCVISRSKEAKKLGVKMGEPLFLAKKEHPEGIYIVANHEYYEAVSKEVMNVLKNFSPYVQIYSIDEAFVDFTGLKRLYKKNYYSLAVFLRNKILQEVNIPVSIGVSKSKTLAKLASDKAKYTKSGVYLIGRKKIVKELKLTGIEEIWGIGRRLTNFFHKSGILKADELVKKDDKWLNDKIGINASEMKHELLGECISPVINEVKLPKSIQQTKALSEFTNDKNYLKNAINYHIHAACRKLRQIDCKASVIILFLRTKDFRIITAKKILNEPCDFELKISEELLKMLDNIYDKNILYRSTGVILEHFTRNTEVQLMLFNSDKNSKKHKNLTKCFDSIERRFGKNAIQTGFDTKKK